MQRTECTAAARGSKGARDNAVCPFHSAERPIRQNPEGRALTTGFLPRLATRGLELGRDPPGKPSPMHGESGKQGVQLQRCTAYRAAPESNRDGMHAAELHGD